MSHRRRGVRLLARTRWMGHIDELQKWERKRWIGSSGLLVVVVVVEAEVERACLGQTLGAYEYHAR